MKHILWFSFDLIFCSFPLNWFQLLFHAKIFPLIFLVSSICTVLFHSLAFVTFTFIVTLFIIMSLRGSLIIHLYIQPFSGNNISNVFNKKKRQIIILLNCLFEWPDCIYHPAWFRISFLTLTCIDERLGKFSRLLLWYHR